MKEWDASVVSKDESGTQMSTVFEMEPGLFRECASLVRNMQERLEILAVSVHAEGDTSMDHYYEHDDMALQTNKTLLPVEAETDPIVELSMEMQKQEIGTGNTNDTKQGGEGKGIKCSTCNTFIGEAKQYREHFKSDWHKHNLKRKTRKARPPHKQQRQRERRTSIFGPSTRQIFYRKGEKEEKSNLLLPNFQVRAKEVSK